MEIRNDVTWNRVQGIGGSDCYTLWHGTPEDVDKLWEIKTGEREPDDLSENFKVLLGTYTETFNHECLIRYLVKRSKTAVMPLPTRDPSICNVAKVIPLSDMDLPLYAHLDAFIEEDNCVVEYKHTSENKLLRDVVDTYEPQCQHYMHLKNAESCILSVIFGNQKHSVKKIKRDDSFINELTKLQMNFWKCVVNNTRPSDTL